MRTSFSAPTLVCAVKLSCCACADPKGEFLSAKLAEPAYKLLGTPGFDLDLSEYEEGPVNQPLWGPSARMGYHRRSG